MPGSTPAACYHVNMEATARIAEKIAAELNRYAYFYSMKDISEARGSAAERSGTRAVGSLASLKAWFIGGTLRPGAEIEGEAYFTPYISMHRPRAYYPEMLLGELRAGSPPVPDSENALPHILPVVKLPPFPDGTQMGFLYPVPRDLFTRYQHPRGVRDALIRDYLRVPLLLPPGTRVPTGRVAFRARLLELRPERLREAVTWEKRELEAYALRGLNLFLAVIDDRHEVRVLDEGAAPPSGSLFAETRIDHLPHHRAEEVMEECLVPAVEELFPGSGRGERDRGLELGLSTAHHVLHFRSRLTAFIYRPAFAVFRRPCLLSLFLPAELGARLEETEKTFLTLYEKVTGALGACGAASPAPRLDFVHEPGSEEWRSRGLLRSEAVEELARERPGLAGALEWLRGAS